MARTLPVLPDKYRRFAEEYIKDKKPRDAALRAGFTNGSAGFSALARPDVAEYIDSIVATAAERAGLTQEWVFSTLKRLIEKSEASKNYAAAIRGVEVAGKSANLFPDKVEVSGALTLEALVLGAKGLK